MSPEILKLIRIRDRLFARKKREPENDLVKITYNKVRNIVSRKISKAKKDHNMSYFETHSNNIKKKHGKELRRLSTLKSQLTFLFHS